MIRSRCHFLKHSLLNHSLAMKSVSLNVSIVSYLLGKIFMSKTKPCYKGIVNGIDLGWKCLWIAEWRFYCKCSSAISDVLSRSRPCKCLWLVGTDRRRSSEVACRSRAALAQRRKSLVRRDGKDYWAIYTTYHQGINPDNLQPYAVSWICWFDENHQTSVP